MLGLKLNHVSKRGHCKSHYHCYEYVYNIREIEVNPASGYCGMEQLVNGRMDHTLKPPTFVWCIKTKGRCIIFSHMSLFRWSVPVENVIHYWCYNTSMNIANILKLQSSVVSLARAMYVSARCFGWQVIFQFMALSPNVGHAKWNKTLLTISHLVVVTKMK